MSGQQRRRKGKAYLAGSSFNSEPTEKPQEPSLPTVQLVPNHAEILVGSENLGTRKRPAKIGATAREQNGLSRRDIARLIVEHPATAKNLTDSERTMLVNIGQGNTTLEEAAASMKMDVPSLNFMLDGPEKSVINEGLYMRLIKPKKGKYIDRSLKDYEWEQAHCDSLADKELAGTAGMFVKQPTERVRKPKTPGTPYGFRQRARTDFNTKPSLRDDPRKRIDLDQTGGAASESDDYGEESGA